MLMVFTSSSRSAFVGVGAHDLDIAPLGVFLDLVGLVVRGVLLMLGVYAHVLPGAEGGEGAGVVGGSGSVAMFFLRSFV